MSQTGTYRRDITQDEIREVTHLLGGGYKSKEIQRLFLERGIDPDVTASVIKVIKKKNHAVSLATFFTGHNIILGLCYMGGIGLIIGNVTGLFPTFPFAGFLLMILGGVMSRAYAQHRRAKESVEEVKEKDEQARKFADAAHRMAQEAQNSRTHPKTPKNS